MKLKDLLLSFVVKKWTPMTFRRIDRTVFLGKFNFFGAISLTKL